MGDGVCECCGRCTVCGRRPGEVASATSVTITSPGAVEVQCYGCGLTTLYISATAASRIPLNEWSGL